MRHRSQWSEATSAYGIILKEALQEAGIARQTGRLFSHRRQAGAPDSRSLQNRPPGPVTTTRSPQRAEHGGLSPAPLTPEREEFGCLAGPRGTGPGPR